MRSGDRQLRTNGGLWQRWVDGLTWNNWLTPEQARTLIDELCDFVADGRTAGPFRDVES